MGLNSEAGKGCVRVQTLAQNSRVSMHMLPPAVRVDLGQALPVSGTWFPYPSDNATSGMLAV